jgi:hypothetical protein
MTGRKKFAACLAMGLLMVISLVAPSTPASGNNRVSSSEAVTRLVGAYNGLVVASGKDAVVVNGVTMKVDQGKSPSTFDELLDQADLVDQLSIPYPVGCPVATPSINEDPGRLRYEPFFTAMYGGTAKAVAKNLTSVDWFGQKVPVTTVNGIDKRLAAVASELASVAEYKKYLSPSAGTYNFRVIAGTKRLSVHSFGAAIDINTKYSDYWRWDGVGKPPKYRNRIPCEIAKVFEKHGFIWGAKWYHYDTMHFEYRLELINE